MYSNYFPTSTVFTFYWYAYGQHDSLLLKMKSKKVWLRVTDFFSIRWTFRTFRIFFLFSFPIFAFSSFLAIVLVLPYGTVYANVCGPRY